MKGKLFVSIIVLVVSAVSVEATTRYVPSQYSTIQAAINACNNGDTVIVADETYYENINFNDKAIVVMSENGPTATTIHGTGIGDVVVGATGSTIQGFTITGSGDARYDCGIQAWFSATMTIRENIITGNWLGIGTSNYHEPLIENNLIYNNSHHGIVAQFYSAPNIINNTIAYNGDHGIYSASGAGLLMNNIIVFNGSNGILCSLPESSPEINYNNVSGNLLGDYSGCNPGGQDISVDPLFVDPAIGDYHLLPDSPCIDVGNNSAFPTSVLTDLDGKSRIINDTVDMGAYEFHCPGILYIDVDAAGANDGSSWANAYNDLQDALAFAWSGDEIRVAQGIYKPDKGAGTTPGDREATFQLINGVTIMGGYAGSGEPDPNARDIDAYETILSGDLLGNDGPGFVNNGENSFHVVTGSGTDATAVLDGFTITAGNANGTDWEGHGGGMYNKSGSPTLTSCTFSGNSAHWGGGVCCVYSSNPILTSCTFSGNTAGDCGGAIFCHYSSSPTIMSCTISQNLAGNHGGGIFCKSPSNPTIMDCAITGNSASQGGGMSNSSSSPTLTNCTFSGNCAVDEDGGGMFNYNSNPTLDNCTFIGNSTDDDGGAIYSAHSSPTLTNCTFIGNSCFGSGGAISCRFESSPILTNCMFTANTAYQRL
jgi:predicted outer membrane repeat protein/parallel beta-helix repeat protein